MGTPDIPEWLGWFFMALAVLGVYGAIALFIKIWWVINHIRITFG